MEQQEYAIKGNGPSPSRYCDLVAKGGVTSGVVYPLAICNLAKRFVFKNLGGTSVGAIAAALAAAAEYGRQKHQLKSFEVLEKLPIWLGEKRTNTNLFMLFQPNRSSKGEFAVCTSFLGGGIRAAGRGFITAVGAHPLATIIGVLPGAIPFALAFFQAEFLSSLLLCLAGIVSITVGTIVSLCVAFLRSLIHVLPHNYYGLCTGLGNANANSEQPALSDWLTNYLDELSGKSAHPESTGPTPLTFGNLWWPDRQTGECPSDYNPRKYFADAENNKAIRLEVIATCLTEGRPYRLPFRDDFDAHENRKFWYRPDEFEKFFPRHIVDWMKSKARVSTRAEALTAQGFYPLPDPWNLPIVVAVRMSLSFPILLSALPMYISKGKGNDLEPCWFSDGGICSNFPIHFFDSPIPEWPTFAINLSERVKDGDPAAWMPSTMSDGANGNLSLFEYSYGQNGLRQAKDDCGKLYGFVKAIIFTMHNWNDSTLSALPGCRERIAHVRLSSEEGGLNLNMPTEVIDNLSRSGRAAANLLIERYSEPQNFEINMESHRWVRFRSMLASLEEFLIKLEISCLNLNDQGIQIESWIESQGTNSSKFYKWTSMDQMKKALSLVSALRDLAPDLNGPSEPLSCDSPRPRPELRGRPRL